MPDGEGRLQVRDASAIQADIERARDEITRSVLALRERMHQATDWREWARRRPLLLMTTGFALGVWLGWRTGR